MSEQDVPAEAGPGGESVGWVRSRFLHSGFVAEFDQLFDESFRLFLAKEMGHLVQGNVCVFLK